ncbi:MAG: hypothetical protein FWG87_05595 [Defluviitaleaceae bacterium]|nr:hypothetical protein [Defluviitaleaceae bacterium]
MIDLKSTIDVKIDTGAEVLVTQMFQPTHAQTYGEQVLDLIKRRNIPHKAVEVNAEGHIIVDKYKDPELYDWAVNG